MKNKKIYKKRNCWRNIKGNWYYRLNIWDGKQNVEWIIPFKEKDKKVANRLYIRYLKFKTYYTRYKIRGVSKTPSKMLRIATSVKNYFSD